MNFIFLNSIAATDSYLFEFLMEKATKLFLQKKKKIQKKTTYLFIHIYVNNFILFQVAKFMNGKITQFSSPERINKYIF